jgi:hypothetical protein
MITIHICTNGDLHDNGNPVLIFSAFEPTGDFILVDTIEHHLNIDKSELLQMCKEVRNSRIDNAINELRAIRGNDD